MINFRLFGFPVRIQWIFWIMCLVLGSTSLSNENGRDGLIYLLMWVVVVFVSIVWHELGHAWATKRFGGYNIEIELHGFGGVCKYLANHTRRESMMVSFAGPLFNFILGAVILVLFFKPALFWLQVYLPFVEYDRSLLAENSKYLIRFVENMILVNFGFGLFNLFPILPLDGGRIFSAYMANRKPSVVPIVGMGCAIAVAVFGLFHLKSIFMGLLFGYLAYQNWQMSQGQRSNRLF